jgi:hypothetical protein
MKVTAAIDLALALIQNAGAVSQLISQARANGQDEIDDAALDGLVGTDERAMANLRSSIELAKSEGR